MARPNGSPTCLECGGERGRGFQYCPPCGLRRRANHNAESGRRRVLRKWGLTADTYEAMVKQQENKCAICKGVSVSGRWNKNWHIDHDHATNQVRGLLCSRCNTAIGLLQDSPELLSAAINYLKGNT